MCHDLIGQRQVQTVAPWPRETALASCTGSPAFTWPMQMTECGAAPQLKAVCGDARVAPCPTDLARFQRLPAQRRPTPPARRAKNMNWVGGARCRRPRRCLCVPHDASAARIGARRKRAKAAGAAKASRAGFSAKRPRLASSHPPSSLSSADDNPFFLAAPSAPQATYDPAHSLVRAAAADRARR